MNDIAITVNKPADVRAIYYYDPNNTSGGCRGVDLYMNGKLILFDPKNPESIVSGFLIGLMAVGVAYTYSAEQKETGRFTRKETIDENY